MNKAKLPNIVAVLILTLLTAVTWIALDVYRAFTVKPAPVVPSEVSNPLTPNLDKDAVSQVEEKIFLDDSQIPNEITSTQTLPAPTASGSAAPSP